MDLEQAEQALALDPSLAFLLPVHLYGRALDLRRLRALHDKHGVSIIEDCAQAIGAKHDDLRAGTVGVAAALSFYPTKNLGCIGDGGAIITDDDGLAERARALRNYGQSSRYVHDQVGFNSRLDELQARIMSAALLPRLAAWNQRRAAIARKYCRAIANPALVLPPFVASGPVWHLYPLLVQQGDRRAFQAHLEAAGVQSAIHYPRLITDQQALAAHGKFEILGPLTRAQAFCRQEVSLPIHPYLADAEIDVVVDACNRWRPA
jgi:dTDP-3-amino-3,4,6-trideoxy-alpha-D-glucose transaminase